MCRGYVHNFHGYHPICFEEMHSEKESPCSAMTRIKANNAANVDWKRIENDCTPKSKMMRNPTIDHMKVYSKTCIHLSTKTVMQIN